MTCRRVSPQIVLTLGLGVVLLTAILAQARLLIHHEGAFYPGGRVPVGADFLVFYGAGRIVADGDGSHLYDPSRQLAEQVEVLDRDRGLAIFPYPAFVALPYAALAGLSLPWAYVVTTVAMVGAAIGAVSILRGVSPTVRNQPFLVGCAVLVSQPLNLAILGGQTVAFSLLCLAGVYAGFRRERDVSLGIWLGLLLYKPQLAFVPVLLVLWRRRWRALGVAGIVGALLTAVGVAAAGPAWPRNFLRLTTGDYYRDNAIVADGVRSISIPAVLRHLTGTDAVWTTPVAAILCLGLLGWLFHLWHGARPADAGFPLRFGVAVAVAILISPHALFYEAALLVLPVIALADRWYTQPLGVAGTPGRFRRRLLLLAGLFGLGYLWPLADLLGVEPLVLSPLIVGFLTWRALRSAGDRLSWHGRDELAPVAPTLAD
jgi:alpha-1,2-mannosyltransferase